MYLFIYLSIYLFFIIHSFIHLFTYFYGSPVLLVKYTTETSLTQSKEYCDTTLVLAALLFEEKRKWGL